MRARDVGAYFEQSLSQLEALPLVGQVRGMKLMMCVENVADKATGRMLPEGLDVGKRISDISESLGLMVRPLGHLNVMSQPLTISREQIDFVTETLERAIRRVTDDLTREHVRLG